MKKFPLALFLLVLSSTANAADFEKGMAAYQAGDFATALAEWRPLAEKGDALAQTNLGSMYNEGKGVARNAREAVKWHRRSAEQGNEGRQIKLGVMYDEGEGVKKDDEQAVKWYRLAAEQGNATAQNNLAIKYAVGSGTTQNNIYAAMWWNIAALNGHDGAKDNQEILAETMSRGEISKAKELVIECAERNYRCENLNTQVENKDEDPFFEWGPIRWDFDEHWLPTIGCNSEIAFLNFVMGCP